VLTAGVRAFAGRSHPESVQRCENGILAKGETMRIDVHKTALLGELVVAAFDRAARYSTDTKEVSRLATDAVMHMLRRAKGSSRVWMETDGFGDVQLVGS
jgi:hypothetical protein